MADVGLDGLADLGLPVGVAVDRAADLLAELFDAGVQQLVKALLPCWGTGRRTCASRCGRAGRCRRRCWRGIRVRRSRPRGRRAAAAGTDRCRSARSESRRQRRSSPRRLLATVNPCQRLVPDGTVPDRIVVRRGTAATLGVHHHEHRRSARGRAHVRHHVAPGPADSKSSAGLDVCVIPAPIRAPDGAPLRRRLLAATCRSTARWWWWPTRSWPNRSSPPALTMLGNIQPNLSRLLGSGSVFALDRDDHRQRRRLLAPPFHGKSIKNYETIIEEETLREIATWPEGDTVRHAAVDDAHHPQRDPARGLRRRGRRTRRAAPNHPAVGHAGLAAGDAAQTAADLRPLHAVGSARGMAGALRRDRRQAHRRRTRRPVLRGPHRRAGADAAQHLRRRLGDVARRHRRRAAHPAGRRPRDHRLGAGLDVRAGQPAPGGADRRWPRRPTPTTTSCGRRRSSRPSAAERLSTPSAATSTPRCTSSASGRSRRVTPSSSASRGCTATPSCSPTRSGSTRSASSGPSRPASPGSPSVAVPDAASAPCSPTWRWTSYCERCCATSRSRPPARPDEKLHARGVAYTPKDGGKIVVRRR